MRSIGTCRFDLLGRLLMFAMRNAHRRPSEAHRPGKAGAPPRLVMVTESARSVA